MIAPRGLLVAALVLSGATAIAQPAGPSAASQAAPSAGERVYRQGLLPSGQPVRGEREGGAGLEGPSAACTTCHRRSGLGSWEGQTVIPPIIGRYLFRAGARNVEDIDLPHVQGYTPHREAYTEATLARTLRTGIDPQGRRLSYLMPRYKLDAGTMASLVGYLKGLTSQPVPGVTNDLLHFATIVTPDADPVARKGMLDVLEQFFADKNAGYRGESRAMQSTRGVMYRVSRKWQLHVWELTGAPETWERQLDERLAAEPVFAVISGLGGKTWAPVHRFCERAALPCLFPNVELPVVAEQDFYTIYFSKGVLLEAQLLARQLASGRQPQPRRVVQVFREKDIGEQAAKALRDALPAGWREQARPLREPRDLGAALQDTSADDVVVLWLRPGDLAALPGSPPAAAVYASGLMGGLENAPLPAPWRPRVQLTYPFDLPAARRVRMNFPLGWFRVRHVAVVAERVQTDTYLACGILAETLSHMLDSFVREYLIERVEALVSHRLVNGYYPRLGLAPGQRFASKGGYLVHFGGPAAASLEADGDWLVP